MKQVRRPRGGTYGVNAFAAFVHMVVTLLGLRTQLQRVAVGWQQPTLAVAVAAQWSNNRLVVHSERMQLTSRARC
jgi:hypothetical protein